MVSDSIINHVSSPPSPKDFPKKKRANRSAKLKQCKLDARREQWLSQVKSNKDIKEEVNGGEFNGPPIEIPKKVSPEEIHHHHHHPDTDSESSPVNSPGSSVSEANDSRNNYTASSSSSSTRSSFSSGGSYSGSITEEEEEGAGGGEDCLDDWEAVADALAAASDDKKGKNPKPDSSPKRENGFVSDVSDGIRAQLSVNNNVDDSQVTKSKPDTTYISGRVAVNSRAWRPDDALRPQTLPNLAKQKSFPPNLERHNAPTSCPICCEDLDLTDSSFLPCCCGFRLCLFCHKRILEDDGRCPGCRKPYAWDTDVEKETSVCGGSLTVKLTRSCSMFSRV